MQTAQGKSFSTSPLKRVRTNQIAGDQAESCYSYYTANGEKNKSARLVAPLVMYSNSKAHSVKENGFLFFGQARYN